MIDCKPKKGVDNCMAITGNLQEKSGKWYAVLNLKDKKGKRKQKWINTGLPIRGNKKKAEKFLREQIAEFEKYSVPYNDIMLSEYFKRWLKSIEKEVRPNTYRSYKGNMENHIIPYFEDKRIPLQKLKAIHLEDYYKSRLELGLSPTTIKHHYQNISKALSDAVNRELILYNPASTAKTPKSEKYKAKFLNPKQLEQLLILVKGNVIELPIQLSAVYGFRRSEVLGLKWQYIDFDRRTITVAETLQQNVGGSYTDKPKTESSYRTLPITDKVFEILQKQKRQQEERADIMGDYYFKSDYVCTWADGKVIQPNYLTKQFHKILKESDLPMVRLHDLRHSTASNLFDKNFSAVQVGDWLGHSSPATTLNFYAHANKTSKNDISNALQDMIIIK